MKLVDDTGYTTALESGQRDVQVMLSLDAYTYGWRIGLALFGVHLLLLGFVMVRSDYAPRVLGRMVALAGLVYLLVMLASVLLRNFEDQKSLFLLLLAVVTVPAEFGLAIWLLWRGGRAEPTSSRRAET